MGYAEYSTFQQKITLTLYATAQLQKQTTHPRLICRGQTDTTQTFLRVFFKYSGIALTPYIGRSNSPELTLGSGVLAQSELVFLLFSIKLVQFGSNFFDLDTNFFGIWPFLDFWERLLNPRVFSSRKMALSAFWWEGLLFPRLALRNLHPFFKKMLIATTTAVAFSVFAVLLAISSAFVVPLRAVSTTLIGRGLWDK